VLIGDVEFVKDLEMPIPSFVWLYRRDYKIEKCFLHRELLFRAAPPNNV
jgi:hypothetical protein